MVVLIIHPPVYSYEAPVEVKFVIRGEEVYNEEVTSVLFENVETTTEAASTEVASVYLCDTIYEYGCSCVLGLVDLGYPVDRFDASQLQSNSTWGVEDDLVLFDFPNIEGDHVACISAHMPDAYEVYECNYRAGTCANRIVAKDNRRIRGFIHNDNFKGLCSISKIN